MDRKYLLKSGIKSAKLSRVLAKAVDLFIVALLALLFYPFGLLIAIIYLALSDSFHGGQSVGKRVVGFNVISLKDGKPCDLKQSIIRNLPFLIPLGFFLIPLWGWIVCSIFAVPLTLFELYLLFKLDSGHRLGDVMADTTVIADDQNRADIKAKNGWFEDQETVATL